jgi:hypothetical protein
MHSCDAGVDLNNIDTTLEVKANVATPIGSLHATLGDFIGDGTWGIYAENGVLTFKDTFSIERKFHNLDLSQYISHANMDLKLHDQLGGLNYIVGTGEQVALTFPMTLHLTGINNNEAYQRLDSALIEHASFVSNITKAGGLPVEWEWIDRVTINLSEKFFHRPEGNIVTIYEKGGKGGYGQNMQINVDDFSLNLMKNRNPQGFRDYWENVVDSCDLSVTMYVTIPAEAGLISVPSDAAFHYDLGVQFIDYKAVWGMFEASSEMSDENEIVIADAWSAWANLKSAKLPLADPSIDLQITTQIAGALELTGDYLYVSDEKNPPVYATFEGNQTFYKVFKKNECLPLSSEIGASKTVHQLFDKDPQRGRIDRLFSIHPEKLGYKFSVDFNQVETPQIRITNNTSIHVDAICNLPFVFNEGMMFDYSDTIADIDLSMLDLDSLLADVTLLDTLEQASAVLALTFTNDIPFQIKGVFTCLDENNNVVIDPKTEKPFLITGNDTVLIPSPEYTYNELALNWIPKPVNRVETIRVDRETLETLQKVKSIALYASIDDHALSDVFAEGNFTTKLTDKEGLRIKIAVGANIEAILKLDLDNEQQ